MVYVGAFFMGGLFCVLAEFLRRRIGGDVGLTMSLMIVLGVLLAALGLLAPLLAIGDAGVAVMVLDCGDAMFDSWRCLLAGNPNRILRFLRDMGVIVGVAAGAGAWRGWRRAKRKERESL